MMPCSPGAKYSGPLLDQLERILPEQTYNAPLMSSSGITYTQGQLFRSQVGYAHGSDLDADFDYPEVAGLALDPYQDASDLRETSGALPASASPLQEQRRLRQRLRDGPYSPMNSLDYDLATGRSIPSSVSPNTAGQAYQFTQRLPPFHLTQDRHGRTGDVIADNMEELPEEDYEDFYHEEANQDQDIINHQSARVSPIYRLPAFTSPTSSAHATIRKRPIDSDEDETSLYPNQGFPPHPQRQPPSFSYMPPSSQAETATASLYDGPSNDRIRTVPRKRQARHHNDSNIYYAPYALLDDPVT